MPPLACGLSFVRDEEAVGSKPVVTHGRPDGHSDTATPTRPQAMSPIGRHVDLCVPQDGHGYPGRTPSAKPHGHEPFRLLPSGCVIGPARRALDGEKLDLKPLGKHLDEIQLFRDGSEIAPALASQGVGRDAELVADGTRTLGEVAGTAWL
jgi:hypothetical protein